MNKVILTGRIVKDIIAEKVGAKGVSKAVFTLAVQRDMKNAEGKYDSDFIRLTSWGGTSTYLQTYAPKGTLIEVAAQIRTGSYKDNEGKTIYTQDIVVEQARVLNSSKPNSDAAAEVPTQSNDTSNVNLTDDDLPF